MPVPPVDSDASLSSSGYEDGLGRRVLAFDRETGGMLERLILRPELCAFEQALIERIAVIVGLEDERFVKPRGIERDIHDRVIVTSEYVPGRRLSDILEAAAEHGIVAGIDAGLGLLLELLPAIARLHDEGLVHGTIAPGRLVITPAAQVVLLDAIYGEPLERLQLTRKRLWSEFRLAFPPTAGSARFDKAADLGHAAMVAATLTVGRALQDTDYPEGIAILRQEILEIASIRGSQTFAEAVDKFFAATLPLVGRRSTMSADEAAIDLRKLVRKELGINTCRTALVEFLQQVETADAERIAAEAAEREAHRAADVDRRGREDADRQAGEVAAVQAREESERRAREDADRQAREDADRRAREEAERHAREEAERQAREEAEHRERQRVEAEQRAREEAERHAREEAERRAREEAERRERERLEAEQRAREEAEQKAREEAERKARAEAEQKAREEAERKAREEAERKAREEAERKAREEAERKAREEAERKAREEAERKAREEAERKAREEAERKAREEAERKAREEAERKAREEAERKAREEAERKAREEAARKAREEAERKAREEAERKAREEAERKAREEAERRERERLEAERKAREEAERKARAEAERKAREEAERKAREEAERKAREEAERKAREEAERKAREEAERKARAEAERKAREEAERKAREEAERKARAEAERKAREEAERKAREEAERKAREEAERKAREEAERRERERLEAEQRAREEAERRQREREEADRAAQQAAAAFAAPPAPEPAPSSWLVPPGRSSAFDAPVADAPPPQAAAPAAPKPYPIYVPPAEPAAWTADLPPADTSAAEIISPIGGSRGSTAPSQTGIRLKGEDAPATAPARAESRRDPIEDDVSAADAYEHRTVPKEKAEIPWKLIAAGVVLIAGAFAVSRGYTPKVAPVVGTISKVIPKPAAKPGSAPVGPNVGRLVITTQPPGAKVTVDGKAAGETPLTIDDVKPGRHTIALASEEGSARRTVRVEAGKELALDVPLFSGFVAISIPFVVDVAEKGKALGTSENQIMLSPGRHELRLANADLGYRVTQTVEVQPGETTRLELDPKAIININAAPWAEVFVDGERVGETPLASIAIRLGVREIVFRNPQFPDKKQTVTVTASSPPSISVDFMK